MIIASIGKTTDNGAAFFFFSPPIILIISLKTSHADKSFDKLSAPRGLGMVLTPQQLILTLWVTLYTECIQSFLLRFVILYPDSEKEKPWAKHALLFFY